MIADIIIIHIRFDCLRYLDFLFLLKIKHLKQTLSKTGNDLETSFYILQRPASTQRTFYINTMF